MKAGPARRRHMHNDVPKEDFPFRNYFDLSKLSEEVSDNLWLLDS